MKLVKVFADSNIVLSVHRVSIPTLSNGVSSPQPFSIKEIVVCNKVLPSDHIFLDDKGFFANVMLEVRSLVNNGSMDFTECAT